MADQALCRFGGSKKAGEFYTPAEVVRICVEICDPKEGMSSFTTRPLARAAC